MSDIKEPEIKFTEVLAKDLPLHCPTDEVALWSSHPRVFLDVAKTGQVACPYCGTKYKLKAGEVVSHHS
ncbi:MAG: zinc-finger domain-containing protein [Methylotenera sp.]|nr:zinc-finger domain-containing protein [Methylotenera sp.]MDP1765503.1 zinc-finger domain-containing protein [Methylotenera sp.]